VGEEEGAAWLVLLRLGGEDDGEDEGEAADAEDGCWCMRRMLMGLWGVVAVGGAAG